MTEIIKNIILIIIICLNGSICAIQSVKIYQDIKKRKRKVKKNTIKSTTKKLILTKNLQNLKNIDLKTPIYAKLNQEDKYKLLKATENIKQKQPEIYMFTTKSLENVKVDNLRNLIINAPYVTINYHKTDKRSKLAGTYSGHSKKIDIYDTSNNTTLYYELLHAASTNYIFSNVGFKVVLKESGVLGEGLNEGYTELLNNRFFHGKSKSYIYLQNLAKLIENFYENKEEMVEDYFNADLFRLIGELLKSMSLEEAIDIIVDIDQLLNMDYGNYIQYLKTKQKILNIYNRKKEKKTPIKRLVKKIQLKNEKFTKLDKEPK